jgi:MFS family permease
MIAAPVSAERDRALRLSIVEGVTYALMVGLGETYFLANAVRLGASALQQGLVVTLPLCLGGGGALLAVAMLARVASRKRIVVAGAALQVVLLAGIAAADALGRLDAALLIAFVCAYHFAGQAAGTAWSSWYGDLVPAEIRGRYFARRNRFIHLATCGAIAAAGFMLQRLEPGGAADTAAGAGGTGYLVTLALAAAARLVSVVLLAAAPEPRFAGLDDLKGAARFLRTGRGTRAWRLLATGTGLQLTVYLASPYFAPFMLEGLRFTYMEYMLATLSVVVAKFLLLPAWGRVVDRHGPRAVYALAAILVGVVPLPWLWANGLAWVVAGQVLSGFSWAGYEVAYLSSLLAASTKRVRPYVFAAQTVCHGVAQLAGGLLGAALLAAVSRDFRIVFAASMVARLGVAALVPRLVPTEPAAEPVARGALLLRVIGFRPHGGLVHRPVDDEP